MRIIIIPLGIVDVKANNTEKVESRIASEVPFGKMGANVWKYRIFYIFAENTIAHSKNFHDIRK